MKGALFFIVFFLLFASAILFIPAPMFPGDTLIRMTNSAALEHASILSALINAAVYGLVAWAVFVLAMRRIETAASKEPARKHRRGK